MVVKYPLSTEKSIRLMEAENKLIFVVENSATKGTIKADMEKTFNVKIKKITTLIGTDGKKRAYIQFSNDTPAIDIATKMGMM